MNESVLRKVNTGLNAKFYATNDTWLRDCVEYYLSEHDNPSHNEVLEFVISQWQLSDLREISNESPCLPENLAQEKCITLRGHFVLQMDKVYDISESKYKQLEKIRNVSNDNVTVTESEQTQAWEPKKKRMLHLHLTDGAQDITAIEYKPIRFLHSNLLPGYKLMIKGPVTCRRGIILLDETNVSEIGGEVETLLVPNALENVLARALNLEENPEPYSEIIEPKPPEDVLFDDDFDIDMEEVALIETQSQERAASPPNRSTNRNPVHDELVYRQSHPIEAHRSIVQPPPISLNQRTESDLLFDMIDDEIFENATEIGSNAKTVGTTGTKVPIRSLPRDSDFLDDEPNNSTLFRANVTKPTTSSSKRSTKTSSTNENSCLSTESDHLFDMIDDEIFENVPETGNNSKEVITSGSSKVPKRSAPPRDSNIFDDDQNHSTLIINKPTTSSLKSIQKSSSKVENTSIATFRDSNRQSNFERQRLSDEFTDDFPMLDIDSVKIPDALPTGKTIAVETATLSAKNRKEPSSAIEDMCLRNYEEFSRQSSFEKRSSPESSIDIDNAKNSESLPFKKTSNIASVKKPQAKEPAQTGSKRNASVLSSPMPNPSAGKMRCTQVTPKIARTNRKITDFMLKDDPAETAAASTTKKIDDIRDLLAASSTITSVSYKTIGGKVASMEKLSRNGQSWQLSATITDLTGSIDVEFSSEILEKLLGLTVAEFSQKKKLKKANPEIEKQLRQGFRSAENKLKNLKSSLRIELAPGKQAKVVEIIETTDEPTKK